MRAVAACLMVGILSGCGHHTTPATITLPPNPVEVVKPVRQDLTRRVVLVGSVEPWAKATLYAKTAGYVKAVLVDKGDAVKRGQLLAILDAPEMQKEVEQARAVNQEAASGVEQGVAEYQGALKDYQAALLAVKQPQAELEVSRAELEKAKRELSMTKRKYEAALEQSKEPGISFQAAEAELSAAKAQKQEAGASHAAAKANLERAAAEVQLRRNDYARYKQLAEREVVTQAALDDMKAKQDSALASAKSAEAEVAAAEARKEAARERVRSTEARLRMAQQQINTSQAQVKTPAAEVDIDAANVAMIRRKLEAIQTKVELSRAQVESVRTKVETAKARQRAATARLSGAKVNMARQITLMDYSRIIAPFDGVVTERFVDVGAMVQTAASSSNAQPVVTVMDLRKVRVYADVPEPDVPSVKLGNPVSISVRELPNREFKGTITRTERALDPATRNMRVEIDLPNSDNALRAGMFAEVKVGMETRRNVLTIPVRCLMVDKQKKSVFIVKEGKAKKADVQTGADDGINVEISAGITAEDGVMISGMTQVKDGTKVDAKQPSAGKGEHGRRR